MNDLRTGMRPWYAVQAQPQREGIAETNLRRVCERVYCPRYRKRVILHGYRREVVRPLFPGYLFAAFDPTTNFRCVHFAHGVRRVLTFGDEPAEVPDSLLVDLRRRSMDGFVRLDPPRLRPGQPVEVVAGPLKGQTGIFESTRSGAERVAILLDTMRFSAHALLDRAAVQALA